MFDPDVAPSGSLLGLLRRGRGDGTLHALAARRAEALAALESCVLDDPRRDWRVESRSLYYARLYMELEGGLDGVEKHLFHADDGIDTGEQRTGLALSVLGRLAEYGRRDAFHLLRRYVATGANWEWALDELASRDDDEGLRELWPAVSARFPATSEGDAALTRAIRQTYEPRPWRLWAAEHKRVRQAEEGASFDRWQRQLRATGPGPGWSVHQVLAWAEAGLDGHPPEYRDAPAARCLGMVAGPADRPELLATARCGPQAARAAALRHLADRHDEEVFSLIEVATEDPSPRLVHVAAGVFERMRGAAAVQQARAWSSRDDVLGTAAVRVLACEGGAPDARRVLTTLRRQVKCEGADAPGLTVLVEGVGRLSVRSAAPVLRHVYRETVSSQLRGQAARALSSTDPSFATGFAVECLWDCEETTRELAATHATTRDVRVLARLRRLAADPAEEAEVQTAIRGRLRSGRASLA